MSKLVKDLISRELHQRYAGVDSAVWVQFSGVDGITNNELRRDLRKRSFRLEIVKNSLLRRAVEGTPLARLAERMSGPAALVTGGESAVHIAKALEEWAPKLKENLKLRGAILEGELIDDARIADLAKMPTKQDLQAQIASAVLSPGGKLAAAILAGGAGIAGCLKTIIEKLEKGDAPEAAAAG